MAIIAPPAPAPALGDIVATALDAEGVPARMVEMLGSFYDAVETLQRLEEVRASLPAFIESANAIIRLSEDGLADYPEPVIPAVRALEDAAAAVMTLNLPRAGGVKSTRPASERSTTGGFNLPAGHWLEVVDATGKVVIVEGKAGNPRWDSLGSRFKALLNGQTLRQAYPEASVAARDALCKGSLAANVGDYTIRVVTS